MTGGCLEGGPASVSYTALRSSQKQALIEAMLSNTFAEHVIGKFK